MADIDISFGAVDRDVAAAARRLVGDVDKSRRRFESDWAKTGRGIGRELLTTFGAKRLGDQMVAFVRESILEFAKFDAAAGASIKHLADNFSALKRAYGRDAFAALFGAEGVQAAGARITQQYNNFADWEAYLLGLASKRELAEINAAQAESAALDENMRLLREQIEVKRQLLEMDSETEAALGNSKQADTLREQIRYQKQLEEIRKGTAGESRDQLEGGAFLLHQARLADIEERDRKRREAANDEAIALRRSGQEAERQVRAREKADGEALSSMEAEARIDELRAKGRDREADQERIRLDLAKKIADIKAREYATEEQKRAAIEAVTRAADAELGNLGEVRDTSGGTRGTREIAPGLASGTLIGQVFGGQASAVDPVVKKTDEVRKKLEEHTSILRDIARNTAANTAVYG